MTKEAVLKAVNDLPSEFEVNELLDKLIFMAKVERGLKDAKEGRTKTLEEAKEISK
jgi:predicted transcriptional regulator